LTVTQDSYWQSVDRIPVYLMNSPAPSMNCYDGSLGNGYDGFGQYSCNWNDVLKLKNSVNLSDANESDDVWLDFILWHQLVRIGLSLQVTQAIQEAGFHRQ